jgi:predicted DNA-binding protein
MKRKNKYKVYEAFRLAPNISKWLKDHAAKTGKTKTRLVEESILAKMALRGDA